MVVKYNELREAIKKWQKVEGCRYIARPLLINPAFPGTFNLSFTEDAMFKEYGGLLDWNHDFHFSTIPSCIRINDLQFLAGENAWKYLGVFEMADVYGVICHGRKQDHSNIQNIQTKMLLDFLTSQGLDRRKIYPSYQLGGKLADVTNGKYSFNFDVPEDIISSNAWLESGIPAENLIRDDSRDTLLSLNLGGRPSPWGYRNEVNYNLGTKDKPRFLDIASIEYFVWRPIFEGGFHAENIVGLTNLDQGASIAAVGLERTLMAINALDSVHDIDYIKPFYDRMETLYGTKDYLAGEALRALHRVCSDIDFFGCELSCNQLQKTRDMIRLLTKEPVYSKNREKRIELVELAKKVKNPYDSQKYRQLLEIHSETQPWHPELKAGIEPTINRIEKYKAVRGLK